MSNILNESLINTFWPNKIQNSAALWCHFCALFQNQLSGPVAAFLMQSRDNPVKALGVAAGVISLMVMVTVMISTAMYLRNTKSNRIGPSRRIIRRRRGEPQQWNFTFGSSQNPDSVLTGHDVESNTKNDRSWSKPPLPCAPVLPPPPPNNNPRMSGRHCAVPTVSGSLSSRSSSERSISSRDTEEHPSKKREGNVSSALVSELKKRLEQKIIEANQGYYCWNYWVSKHASIEPYYWRHQISTDHIAISEKNESTSL